MARRIAQQDLPDSGERVMMPAAKSRQSVKPPKPMSPSEQTTARNASKQRKSWEATPEGQRRTQGMETLQGAGPGMRHMILRDHHGVTPDTGPRVYDRQLPGMADPNQAPRPPKWEELDDNQRAHTERALKLHGTSVDTMTKDFGAQLDQATLRAHEHGTGEPYASRFYERGSAPRDRIDQSAKDLGVPSVVHAMTNAFTSPNTKFSLTRSDGSTSYPNDVAASHATKWVQQGGDPEKVTNRLADTGSTRPGGNPDERAQGYVTNMRKAAKAVDQHLAGVEPADWKLGTTDKSPFETAPKTGPYGNSWSDSHPQFTVADVHTGGGGAFPHLGADKPILKDAEGKDRMTPGGKPWRDKSGRERAIEKVPNSHSVIDYANRQAMAQRGMGSVRRSQATQWGEEQIQRGEGGLRGAPTPGAAYAKAAPHINSAQFSDEPHQLNLLDQSANTRRPDRPRESTYVAELPKHGEVDRRSEAAKRAGTPF